MVDSDGCPPWDHYRATTVKPWQASPELRVLILSGDTLQMQSNSDDELPLISLYLMRIRKAP